MANERHDITHSFAGNPVIFRKRNSVSTQELKDFFLGSRPQAASLSKILPLFHGKPLIAASLSQQSTASWFLAWQSPQKVDEVLLCLKDAKGNSDEVSEALGPSTLKDDIQNYERLVYLGERDCVSYFALDISALCLPKVGAAKEREVSEKFETVKTRLAFTDLRTIMVATDWSDEGAMGELSIAGHARAMVEWHNQANYCGRCGTKTHSIMAGLRRQCTNSLCKHKLYPRIDPVVIMLVIDRGSDSVLLGRQSRFSPRMWSCLAGFIEPGESLEEAVRRETYEETGIVVGKVLYHSSQPWPVGPSSMSCQLMVGFFAFAKTFNIHVDGKELEDAQWHTRDQVCHALQQVDFKEAQESVASKVYNFTIGDENERGTTPLYVNESATLLVPGPYAIAHHLISTWATTCAEEFLSKF